MPGNIKSQRQAGLFGMVAAGKKKLPGLSKDKAKESLRGANVNSLPKLANTKKLPNALEQSNKRLRKMPTIH